MLTAIVHAHAFAVGLMKSLEIDFSKIIAHRRRRFLQRLTTPRLPKYRFLIPYISLLFATLFIILPFSGGAAYAMDATLAWDANSEADLTGYRIYYKTGIPGPPYDGEGASEGGSPISVAAEELKNPNTPQYIIHGLSDTETVYLTLTAFNADGMESGYSNEVSLGVANQPPVASFTADPPSGEAPLLVFFDARESRDPDGAVDSYNWNFGDGTAGSGEIVTHEYDFPGTYTVSLTATDDLATTDEAMDTITVTQIGMGTIHLGDLAAGKKVRGKRGLWEVFVTVTVHDQECNPIAGAKVVGEWSNALSGSASGTTGRRGTAKFKTGKIRGGDSVTFTVIEVERDAFTYDAYDNHEGTTIEIFKK
jgi:PKD repeat protein